MHFCQVSFLFIGFTQSFARLSVVFGTLMPTVRWRCLCSVSLPTPSSALPNHHRPLLLFYLARICFHQFILLVSNSRRILFQEECPENLSHPRVPACSQVSAILGPFEATQIPTLIIIDALDECKDGEPASAILSILSHYVKQTLHVKFFITGRPERRIRSVWRPSDPSRMHSNSTELNTPGRHRH